MSAASTHDRRHEPRLALGLAAHCQVDGVVSQETLGDLSADGLYLQTSQPWKVGARVRLVVGLPYFDGQRVCSLSGDVTWVDHGADGAVTGAGIRFDRETSVADKELVRGFLSLWMPGRNVGA